MHSLCRPPLFCIVHSSNRNIAKRRRRRWRRKVNPLSFSSPAAAPFLIHLRTLATYIMCWRTATSSRHKIQLSCHPPLRTGTSTTSSPFLLWHQPTLKIIYHDFCGFPPTFFFSLLLFCLSPPINKCQSTGQLQNSPQIAHTVSSGVLNSNCYVTLDYLIFFSQISSRTQQLLLLLLCICCVWLVCPLAIRLFATQFVLKWHGTLSFPLNDT